MSLSFVIKSTGVFTEICRRSEPICHSVSLGQVFALNLHKVLDGMIETVALFSFHPRPPLSPRPLNTELF